MSDIGHVLGVPCYTRGPWTLALYRKPPLYTQVVFDNKIEIFVAAAAIIGGISMPPGLP